MAERKGSKHVDTSKTFVVHPDMAKALETYKDKRDIDKVFDERNKILEDGGKYWNPLHDEEFSETAEENTNNAVVRGWKFPQRKKR